jgi:hypothetical protein
MKAGQNDKHDVTKISGIAQVCCGGLRFGGSAQKNRKRNSKRNRQSISKKPPLDLKT